MCVLLYDSLLCCIHISSNYVHICICMTFVNDSQRDAVPIVHLNKAELTSLPAHVDPRSKESKLET